MFPCSIPYAFNKLISHNGQNAVIKATKILIQIT